MCLWDVCSYPTGRELLRWTGQEQLVELENAVEEAKAKILPSLLEEYEAWALAQEVALPSAGKCLASEMKCSLRQGSWHLHFSRRGTPAERAVSASCSLF